MTPPPVTPSPPPVVTPITPVIGPVVGAVTPVGTSVVTPVAAPVATRVATPVATPAAPATPVPPVTAGDDADVDILMPPVVRFVSIALVPLLAALRIVQTVGRRVS